MALDYTKQIITSGYATVDVLNENFADIETALADALSLSGNTPNAMTANLDMNSNRIINLASATANSDAVNLGQVNAQIAASLSSGVYNTVNSVTALTALDTSSTTVVHVLGYSSAGDGGGGFFYWDSASTDTADDGVTFESDAGGTGRWKRVVNGFVSIKGFGAVGDATADDTAAIQACLTYCAANFKTMYVPKGQYKITSTLNKASSFRAPNIIGDDANESYFYGVGMTADTAILRLKGGSGFLTKSVISHVRFQADADDVYGIQLEGQGGVTMSHCYFRNLKIGIYMTNVSSGEFSEFNVAEYCDFASSVIRSMSFNVDAGNDSFHGSGMRNCVINEAAGRTAENIAINTDALLYNSPMDFTIFKRTNEPVFQHNGDTRSNIYGNIRVECAGISAPELCDGNSLSLVGDTNVFGGNLSLGTAVLSHRVHINTDGSVNREVIRDNFQVACTTGANTILGIGSDTTTLVHINLRGSNYEYVYLLSVYKNSGDNSGSVVILANHRSFNSAGYGAPTFSFSSGNLVVTNGSWPASGISAVVSYVPIGTRFQFRME